MARAVGGHDATDNGADLRIDFGTDGNSAELGVNLGMGGIGAGSKQIAGYGGTSTNRRRDKVEMIFRDCLARRACRPLFRTGAVFAFEFGCMFAPSAHCRWARAVPADPTTSSNTWGSQPSQPPLVCMHPSCPFVQISVFPTHVQAMARGGLFVVISARGSRIAMRWPATWRVVDADDDCGANQACALYAFQLRVRSFAWEATQAAAVRRRRRGLLSAVRRLRVRRAFEWREEGGVRERQPLLRRVRSQRPGGKVNGAAGEAASGAEGERSRPQEAERGGGRHPGPAGGEGFLAPGRASRCTTPGPGRGTLRTAWLPTPAVKHGTSTLGTRRGSS